ncbi:Sodium/hydrogen exchanger family-domain-containing protein [Astrocystis sublimbata]|nr:Sodium/hydrogen exchanger family-domain-containing protein [Astrocystis sublimbata]
MSTTSYLPYHEPSLRELLVASTFLLALNTINSMLDRTLACGLVGQVPIALSFALLATPGPFLGTAITANGDGGGGAGFLPAFASGAALCSTSLGTTFSVLQASGLGRTRVGAVLASAALLDDVVGLVMVRIITSLGQTGDSGIKPETILRPVLVSVAFALVVPLACRYALRPGQRMFYRHLREQDSGGKEGSTSKSARIIVRLRSQEAAFVAQTALLIALVVAANYAGASILLAAYLAGVVVSWWGAQQSSRELLSSGPQRARAESVEGSTPSEEHARDLDGQGPETADEDTSSRAVGEESQPQPTALRVFGLYYSQAVSRVFKPFFFASIGFSIPISQLFEGGIVGRGIVYSILMVVGKLVCGLWLVRYPVSVPGIFGSAGSSVASRLDWTLCHSRSWSSKPKRESTGTRELQMNNVPPTQSTGIEPITPRTSIAPNSSEVAEPPTRNSELDMPPRPVSLYPAAIMGCAMVARGEIGFLISSMAESQGAFRRPDEDASKASALFLIVTWAIFVCTILGPVCTGLLVRLLKSLEKSAQRSGVMGGTRDVLGVWGVG